jgi:hypothetical protein
MRRCLRTIGAEFPERYSLTGWTQSPRKGHLTY